MSAKNLKQPDANKEQHQSKRQATRVIKKIIIGALSCLLILPAISTAKNPLTNFKLGLQLSAIDRTQAHILSWSNTALMQIYSLDFMNLRKEFNASSHYFTPDAWKTFVKALEQAGVINLIKQKKMVMGAVPTDVPVITEQGDTNGRYTWKIETPLLIVFKNNKDKISRHWNVTMVISRAPNYIGIDGLVIESMAAKLVKAKATTATATANEQNSNKTGATNSSPTTATSNTTSDQDKTTNPAQ